MTDLLLLQLIRVKGLVDAAGLASSTSAPVEAIRDTCAVWAREGLVLETPRGVRLTATGRERLASLLEHERAGLDLRALQAVYDQFGGHNRELKAAITAWQMRDATTANDHSDAAYDRDVIARIAQINVDVSPVLAKLSTLVPRCIAVPLSVDSFLQRSQR